MDVSMFVDQNGIRIHRLIGTETTKNHGNIRLQSSFGWFLYDTIAWQTQNLLFQKDFVLPSPILCETTGFEI